MCLGGASSLLPEELMPPARGGCTGFLRWLRTILCFLLSSSLNRVGVTETSETARYTKSVLPASGLARAGDSTTYCLIAVKASSHSLFHPARLAPLRVAKNGFRRSVNREMNRLRAANRPVNCCTSFLEAGARDSKIALS